MDYLIYFLYSIPLIAILFIIAIKSDKKNYNKFRYILRNGYTKSKVLQEIELIEEIGNNLISMSVDPRKFEKLNLNIETLINLIRDFKQCFQKIHTNDDLVLNGISENLSEIKKMNIKEGEDQYINKIKEQKVVQAHTLIFTNLHKGLQTTLNNILLKVDG